MLHEMVYTPRNLLMVIILLAFLNPVQRSGGWIRTSAKCLHCHFGYTWTNLFINVFCSIMPKSFTNELIRHDLTGRGHVFREVTPLRSPDHWRPLPLSRCQNYMLHNTFFFFFPRMCVMRCVNNTQQAHIQVKVTMLIQGKCLTCLWNVGPLLKVAGQDFVLLPLIYNRAHI